MRQGKTSRTLSKSVILCVGTFLAPAELPSRYEAGVNNTTPSHDETTAFPRLDLARKKTTATSSQAPFLAGPPLFHDRNPTTSSRSLHINEKEARTSMTTELSLFPAHHRMRWLSTHQTGSPISRTSIYTPSCLLSLLFARRYRRAGRTVEDMRIMYEGAEGA